MNATEQQSAAERAVTEFNAAVPPGSPVLAWPGTRDADPLRTRTRYSAWVLASGEPVVSVVGYPGGIALTHVDPDPTRQPAVPDIEWVHPPCPLCGDAVDSDGDQLVCLSCGVTWDQSGAHGTWDEPDAARCPATRALLRGEHGEWREQCALASYHAAGTHRPADGIGGWADGDSVAVIDSDGEAIA